MSKRIGIYSGSFNPVHAGHISFALQAIKEAKLDLVYLMPERYNPRKKDMEHFGHRVAMIRQAIKPHNRLGLIESSEVSFSVDKTLPKLQFKFKDDQLVFLFGSELVKDMANWPNIKQLLNKSELVVGIREGDDQDLKERLKTLPTKPKQLYLIQSHAPGVSSRKVREALRKEQDGQGILTSVKRYSNRNWLYISLS